jgi:hypothetical protein
MIDVQTIVEFTTGTNELNSYFIPLGQNEACTMYYSTFMAAQEGVEGVPVKETIRRGEKLTTRYL